MTNAERQAAYRARRSTLRADEINDQIRAAVLLGRQTERYELEWPTDYLAMVPEFVEAERSDATLQLLRAWVAEGRLIPGRQRGEATLAEARERWLRVYA